MGHIDVQIVNFNEVPNHILVLVSLQLASIYFKATPIANIRVTLLQHL